MLKVFSPLDSPEIRYAVFLCFDHFLGITSEFVADSTLSCFQIKHGTSSQIFEMANCFDRLTSEQTHVRKSSWEKIRRWNLAKSGLDAHLIFESLPVVFGSPVLSRGGEVFYMGVDVFSMVFFMVSRIEEIGTSELDAHERFPGEASVAFKADFLERPIVDEYIEVLFTILNSLWPELKRRQSKSEIYVSCDVDEAFELAGSHASMALKTCLIDLLRRRNFRLARNRLLNYFYSSRGDYRFDKKYTFDWYMALCEREKLGVSFYFIPLSEEEGNATYEISDPRIVDLMESIVKRGHDIGVHGSYQTYVDKEKMAAQKAILENALAAISPEYQLQGNRQHYLKWNSARSPGCADAAGFSYDSTGGYADKAGFRYGTSKDFPMWDFEKKRMTKLLQRPLIVMDTTLLANDYMGITNPDEIVSYVLTLFRRSIRFGGNFNLLWHNSSLDSEELRSTFAKIIKGLGATL